MRQGGGNYGSPLHIATKKLNFHAVQKIIEMGEDPNRIDAKGNTPLHYALDLMVEKCEDAKRIMQFLLEHKANPNVKNRENWTPLHIVARKRDGKVLDWILSYNLEVQDIHGGEEVFELNKGGGSFNWTAMHISAYIGAPDLVMKLGEIGVNIFKKSVNGYTPKKVVNRPSVTLKLLEKYEHDWITKNIIHKMETHPESLACLNLLSFNSKKEISNASKNKFEGASFYVNSPGDNSFLRTMMVKNRVRMLSPLLGTGPISKRQDYDDSLELLPETEPGLEGVSEVEEELDLIDFNSDLNEGVNIEVNPYSKEVPLSQNKKDIVIRAKKTAQKYFDKEEQEAIKQQSTAEFEVENYEYKLKRITNFDINFCRTELRYFKDSMSMPKSSFIDKVKIFTAIKVLHKYIVQHVYRSFQHN